MPGASGEMKTIVVKRCSDHQESNIESSYFNMVSFIYFTMNVSQSVRGRPGLIFWLKLIIGYNTYYKIYWFQEETYINYCMATTHKTAFKNTYIQSKQ